MVYRSASVIIFSLYCVDFCRVEIHFTVGVSDGWLTLVFLLLMLGFAIWFTHGTPELIVDTVKGSVIVLICVVVIKKKLTQETDESD